MERAKRSGVHCSVGIALCAQSELENEQRHPTFELTPRGSIQDFNVCKVCVCAAAPFTPIVGTLEVNRDTDTDAEEETDSHAERQRDSKEFLECFGEVLGPSFGSWRRRDSY